METFTLEKTITFLCKTRYKTGKTFELLWYTLLNSITAFKCRDCRSAAHQKPPLCKGRWAANGGSEGLCCRKQRICIHFQRNRNIVLHQSLSHAIRVTAPFTQGSLRRSSASAKTPPANGRGCMRFLSTYRPVRLRQRLLRQRRDRAYPQPEIRWSERSLRWRRRSPGRSG